MFLALPMGGGAGAAASPDANTATAPRPNVLIILTDDQVASNFTRSLMPNVFSELVDQGVRFNRAYVETPLCCPSRAQLMTGLYAHHTGVDGNDDPLGPARPTVAEALQDSGYQTMLAGKYLNSESCDPHPGWDRWVCVKGTSVVDPLLEIDGVPVPTKGYQPDILAEYASSFLETADPTRPFFIEYAPTVPHLPADDPRNEDLVVDPARPPSYDEDTSAGGKPAFLHRPPLTGYERARIDENHDRMTRVLQPLDDAIGSLLDSLGERERDTMVLFMSDNGFMYGEHRLTSKFTAYEESVKVPFVIRYPALVPAGSPFSSSALVSNVDVTPTILELAGVPWIADGKSLVPLLSRTRSSVRSALLIEHCHASARLCLPGADDPHELPSYFGVVTGRHKYIEYATGERELYHLRADPHELDNLAVTEGAAVLEGRMRALLHGLLAEPAAPPVTLVTGAAGSTSDRTPTFRFFSPNLPSRLSCRVDGAAWSPCSSPTTLSPLPDGEHTFEVRATDEAGRQGPLVSRSFSLSTSGPKVEFTSFPPDPTDRSAVSFTFSSGGQEMECRLTPLEPPREVTWSACTSGVRAFEGLRDGAYMFEVRARSATGEITDPPAYRSFRVTTAGPIAQFHRSPPTFGAGAGAEFGFHLSVPSSGPVRCRLDGAKAMRCGHGRAVYDQVSEGPHTFAVTATDQFGQTATTVFDFTIDRTAPVATVSDGPDPFTPDGDGQGDQATIRVTATEQVRTEVILETEGGMQLRRFRSSLASVFRATWDGTDSDHVLCPPGVYRYVVVVTDRAGNQTTTGGLLTIAPPAD